VWKGLHPENVLADVLDSVGAVKQALDERLPLIGFSGAPFTLASYLLEGSASRDFAKTKTMMYSQPELWMALMSRLSRIVSSYLLAQVHAGADAVQLFDSWSGCLSPTDYHEFVLPYNKEILESLSSSRVPRVNFGVGTAGILRIMKEASGDVIGVDWRVPIDEAWRQVG